MWPCSPDGHYCVAIQCLYGFGCALRAQPFNFPLEIPALQVLGALFMGNKPLVHVDHRCACPGIRSSGCYALDHILMSVRGRAGCCDAASVKGRRKVFGLRACLAQH